MGRKRVLHHAKELALASTEAAQTALNRVVRDKTTRHLIEGCIAVALELVPLYEKQRQLAERFSGLLQELPEDDPDYRRIVDRYSDPHLVRISWDKRLEWSRRILGEEAPTPSLRWLAMQFADRFLALYIWPAPRTEQNQEGHQGDDVARAHDTSVRWVRRGTISLLAVMVVVAGELFERRASGYAVALASVAGGLEQPPVNPEGFVENWGKRLLNTRKFLRDVLYSMRREVASLDPSISAEIAPPGDPEH